MSALKDIYIMSAIADMINFFVPGAPSDRLGAALNSIAQTLAVI